MVLDLVQIYFPLDLTSGSGKNTGPRDNLMAHCYFHDVDRQAIWAKFGVKNFSEHNKFDLCGNSEVQTMFQVIV